MIYYNMEQIELDMMSTHNGITLEARNGRNCPGMTCGINIVKPTVGFCTKQWTYGPTLCLS